MTVITTGQLEGHFADDTGCSLCAEIIKGYGLWPNEYPVPCPCGGLFHVEAEWQGDEGYESPYSQVWCDKCGKLKE